MGNNQQLINKPEQSASSSVKQDYIRKLIEATRTDMSSIIKEMMKISTKELIGILNANFELSIELLFNLLSIQECFSFLDNSELKDDDKSTVFIFELINTFCDMIFPEKYRQLSMVLSHHPGIEHTLVMHRLYALYCSGSTQQHRYPSMIPTFIRITAFILQNYLKLKNQPSKSNEDHIANDQIVIINTEKWIAKSLFIFFDRLVPPQQQNVRKIVIIALGDLIGAHLESAREGNVDKQILNDLLHNCLTKYFFKNFKLQEASNLFIQSLRNCNFQNPEKNIEIPEQYALSHDIVQMNTQAMALLILQFVKSPSAQVFSPPHTLKLLIPVISEILPRPYEIKIQLLGQLEKILQNVSPIQIESGLQWDYPIYKFFFSLKYHQNQMFGKLVKFFSFKSTQVELNSLLILKDINIQNLNVEKDRFIIHCLEQQKFDENQRVFLLLKSFKFSECNEICQQILIKKVQKLMKVFESRSKQILIEWRQKSGSISSVNRQKIVSLLE